MQQVTVCCFDKTRTLTSDDMIVEGLAGLQNLNPFVMQQVAVCCFDKTGTLTSDDMVLEGLAGLPGHGYTLLRDVKEAGIATLRVLAGCHSLIYVDGELMGDPLERATFQATGTPSRTLFACGACV
jgi:magnesium-transporting ATPase (P-type)